MKLSVSWTMTGTVDVKGKTIKEAMRNFNKEYATIPIPEGTYVEDSFVLTTEDPEEMEEIMEGEL